MRKHVFGYADSEGPDQSAHSHSLIRAVIVRYQNHLTLKNVSSESKSILRIFEDSFSLGAGQDKLVAKVIFKYRITLSIVMDKPH